MIGDHFLGFVCHANRLCLRAPLIFLLWSRTEKRLVPPPTPAPSANLDEHSETHSNRNRGVMTHDLSAALAKSGAAPGGPTGEAHEVRGTSRRSGFK
jgi:hypothetical protein